MANSRYKLGWEKFLTGSIDMSSDTIKCALVESAYTPNTTTHEFVSDLGANILARSSGLSSKSVSLGTFDAADITFTAVPGGDTGTYLVLYKDTGVDATSPLIGVIDTGTGLPITTNGGDVTVQWSNGSDKIFTL